MKQFRFLFLIYFFSSNLLSQTDKKIDFNDNVSQLVSSKDFVEKLPSNFKEIDFEQDKIFNRLFDQDGAFYNFKKEAELISKRTLNSKSFLKSNGAIVTVVGAGEYHYLKNGVLNSILDDIHSNNDSNFPLANIYNAHQLFFGTSDSKGITFKGENEEIYEFFKNVKILFLDSNKNIISSQNLDFQYDSHIKNKIVYKTSNSGISFCLEKNNLGYKTSYLINSINDFGSIPSNTFYIAISENIKTPIDWNYSFSESGTLNFKEKGEIKLKYNRPVLFSESNPQNAYIGNYLFVGSDLLILSEANWITDPGTIFPVVFDPAVTYNPNNTSQHTGTVEEDGGCSFGGNNDYDDEMRIGFDDGTSDNDYYSSFARFNISGIPDANCVTEAYSRYYQYNFTNGRSNENNLKFYYQPIDPSNFQPTTTNCTDIYNNLDATASYTVWDVFGTGCSGNDYNETNGAWKDFTTNVNQRVQSLLSQDFVVLGFDNARNNCGSNHTDDIYNNDEWLTFYGRSNANKPQLIVTHSNPTVTITHTGPSTTLCTGGSTTFSSSISGNDLTPTYQWQSSSDNSTFNNILGQTSSTLTTASLSSSTYFRLVATQNAGLYGTNCVKTSSSILITVNQNPTTANAGLDQTGSSTCGLTSVTLAGNSPTVGTALWSIISGTGGNIITTPSPISTFTGTAGSTYILRWTISNSPCAASTDDVVITFNQNPTTANAGADQTGSSTCGLTSVTLAGNSPSVGTGAWSIISGSGGSVTTPSSATSTFTGTAGSTYTLRWTISNSLCTASFDDVVITFNQNPTAADAGASQTGLSTCGLTSVTLAGNSPSVGTGAWSIISGGGSVILPSSPTSPFTGTAGSTNILRWTVSNSPCTASMDDVMIVFNRNPTTANAGADQTGSSTCGLTSVTLAGNSPSVGTGAWSIISGSGGSVTTPSSATSTFTGTAGSTYTLRWTVSNSPCTASTDDVVITFNQNPTANAGADQTGLSTCGLTSVTLAGNSQTFGTGAWSIISGSGGSLTTPSSATSAFTGTAGSTYNLRWTRSNSPCTASTDDVVITFNQNPTASDAGADQTGLSTCGLTSVTLAGNSPSVGTGAWSIQSGIGGSVTTPSSTTSAFTGTAGSTYTLRWTVSNSPCTASTDDVVITFNQNPTISSAGADQTGSSTCGLTSVTLAGNSPSVGTGAWSIQSGIGGSVTTPSSTTSAFTGTAGSTYTLRWTVSNSPCTASTDDVVITFNQNPTAVSVSGGGAICSGSSATLNASNGSSGTIYWQNTTSGGTSTETASTSQSISSAGTYYFRARSVEGCWSTQGSETITVDPTSIAGTSSANQTVCVGANVNPLTLIGYTGNIQWQSSTTSSTSGFNNISSATNPALPLGSLSTTTYYQAVVTSGVCPGVNSNVVTITVDQPITNISINNNTIGDGDYLFTGKTSRSVNNINNWYILNNGSYSSLSSANDLPQADDEIFIISSTEAQKCVSATNKACVPNGNSFLVENIFVGDGAEFECLGNGQLNFSGDFINRGTFSAANSTINLSGTDNQSIIGLNPITFNNFSVNKNSGNVILNAPVIVKGTLNMTKGDIISDATNFLTIGTSSSSPGSIQYDVNTGGKIIGPLRRYFDAAATLGDGYYFPVGNNANANTRGVTIDFNGSPGVNQFLTIEYKSGYAGGASPLSSGLPLTTNDGVLIQNLDDEGYWEMNPTNNDYGSSINSAPYTVTLNLKNLTGVTDRTTVRIVKAAGSNNPATSHTTWTALTFGSTPVLGNDNSDFKVSGTTTGFSWFGAGGGNSNPLPVELLSFTGNCSEGQTILTWQTASEFNSAYFEVHKSMDGENWRVINTQDAAGNSTELLSYQVIEESNAEQNAYYRLNQVDENGEENLYDPILISCSDNEEFIKTFPNPSDNSFQILVSDKNLVGKATMEMVDMKGTVVSRKEIKIIEGTNLIYVNENLTPGIYYIKITNRFNSSKVIKHVIR